MLNTDYAKLTDGEIIFFDSPVFIPEDMTIDGEIFQAGTPLYTNKQEVIVALGFKPVIYSPMPEREGYYYSETWLENVDSISQVWAEHENPPEPVVLSQEEYDDMTAALAELGVNPNGEMA